MKLYSTLFLALYFLSSQSINSVSANQAPTIVKRNTVNSFASQYPSILTSFRLIGFPIEDGLQQTLSSNITNYNKSEDVNLSNILTSSYVSLTLPVSILDGNADYTVRISPTKPDSQYNIAYIIDTSSSINEQELQNIKDAYISLTNYFIDNGIGENSNFAVISFNEQAISQDNLTAEQAIYAIKQLKVSINSQAKHNKALEESYGFISQSPLDKSRVQNLVYYFTKGKSKSQTNDDNLNISADLANTQQLQKYAYIKAFGIKDNLDATNKLIAKQLNLIDSDRGVLVPDTSDLKDVLMKSELAGKIAEIKILLDGNVVEIIQPEQLIDTSLGLTYKGSIDGLDISANAENIVTA